MPVRLVALRTLTAVRSCAVSRVIVGSWCAAATPHVVQSKGGRICPQLPTTALPRAAHPTPRMRSGRPGHPHPHDLLWAQSSGVHPATAYLYCARPLSPRGLMYAVTIARGPLMDPHHTCPAPHRPDQDEICPPVGTRADVEMISLLANRQVPPAPVPRPARPQAPKMEGPGGDDDSSPQQEVWVVVNSLRWRAEELWPCMSDAWNEGAGPSWRVVLKPTSHAGHAKELAEEVGKAAARP